MSSHMLEDDEPFDFPNLPPDLMKEVMKTMNCRDTLALCKSSKDQECPNDVEYWKKCCSSLLNDINKLKKVLEKVTLRPFSPDFLDESSGDSYLWWKKAADVASPFSENLYADFSKKWENKIGDPAETYGLENALTSADAWFLAVYGISKMRVTANLLSAGHFITLIDVLTDVGQTYKLGSPLDFDTDRYLMEEIELTEDEKAERESATYHFYAEDNDSSLSNIQDIVEYLSSIVGDLQADKTAPKDTMATLSLIIQKLLDFCKKVKKKLPGLECAKHAEEGGKELITMICDELMTEFAAITEPIDEILASSHVKNSFRCTAHYLNMLIIIKNNRRWFREHYGQLIAKHTGKREERITKICEALKIAVFEPKPKVLADIQKSFADSKSNSYIYNNMLIKIKEDNRRWFSALLEPLITLVNDIGGDAPEIDEVYLRDSDGDRIRFPISTIKLKMGSMSRVRVIENLSRV